MVVSRVQLSKAVSLALRHEPWLHELELDAEGWAPVDQLLAALASRGGDWRTIDRESLVDMVESVAKQRHELVGDRIRARYGHSLPGRIEMTPSDPPEVLFHGTAPGTWRSIRVDGLRPMGRQYVHMSVDVETAMAVGRRKSDVPVLLSVATSEAVAAGVEFFAGNAKVWLALHVPPEFIRTDAP